MSTEAAVWLASVALVVLGAAGIAWFVLSGRRPRPKPWDDELARQAGDARWFGDRVVPAATDRARPLRACEDLWREHLNAVMSTEHLLERLAETAPDAGRRASAAALAAAFEDLRLAADADLRLRDGGEGDAVRLEQSAGIVERRRAVLAADVAAVLGPPAQA